jgi:putative membrane protein
MNEPAVVIKRQPSDYLMVFLKGVAMGAADIVPGVSGGTIAFITHIYDELLSSIRSLRPAAVVVLIKEGPQAFWQAVNGSFLMTLVMGIAFSLFTLGSLISHQLESNPIQVGAFFCGLIVASIVYMLRQFERISPLLLLSIALGTTFIVLLPMKPLLVEPSPWLIFGAGALGICAMILPGISGSFILLLLGMYPVVLEALKTLDFVTLGILVAGCLAGLLSFSHLLSALLKHFREPTLGVLTGFLLGSLSVIWPWKEVLETRLNSQGEWVPLVTQNLAPGQFELVTGLDSGLFTALTCGFVGFTVVFGLELFASRGQKSSRKSDC